MTCKKKFCLLLKDLPNKAIDSRGYKKAIVTPKKSLVVYNVTEKLALHIANKIIAFFLLQHQRIIFLTFNMSNINNINNANKIVIVSKLSKKYDTALTEFNSIFLVRREFSSVVAVREAARAYGAKHNIALTTAYSSSSRIKLICKHSGEYRDIRKAEKAAQVLVNGESPLSG
ncbi:hypothetical protein PHYBLDRAFT_66339 [Phycomyces blakesleeanus NRRL 1555(-)]|uniref:Uncharacterized protein n=1 Tax=Phycomyces blakesleeanus (strain ATCC 8743b / DSM 1359 / FGSC 10004 / NBRC 33097 / NRRL 1555) TaxID=763407 RepID=A0A163D819_PHYB8|nr:hypothetical protein PHYBLDRAFT_66339 [Phycomyces blakesleeanus NRRL 1555(-)]OAD69440.1 hypothetical protein PHYBLDRAFT_66339 [Phycomyces blakesleeanus NRRL 1555(-)]|eukprot:XP_018287480.1 hypothetical protein PHYBLDRAFT_66339 [Phycomyces blakesleeanus NRRL 1555(-)]